MADSLPHRVEGGRAIADAPPVRGTPMDPAEVPAPNSRVQQAGPPIDETLLNEIRRHHWEEQLGTGTSRCGGCRQAWECDAYLLVTSIDSFDWKSWYLTAIEVGKEMLAAKDAEIERLNLALVAASEPDLLKRGSRR